MNPAKRKWLARMAAAEAAKAVNTVAEPAPELKVEEKVVEQAPVVVAEPIVETVTEEVQVQEETVVKKKKK
jgi:hypothetical protein